MKFRIFTLIISLLSFLMSNLALAQETTLIAPDNTEVTISRDDFGVPHITAETEVGVFYGQGFAAAEDRLFQMETFRRAGQGRLAALMGPSFIEMDREARTLYYTEAERWEHFQALSAELQTALEAYRDGVNYYLGLMADDPETYMPGEVALFMDGEVESWEVTHSIAAMQYIIRQFGGFGGEELTRLTELQQYGPDWFEENRPINDPDAPTTIPGGGEPEPQTWHYSGMTVRPEIVAAINARRASIRQLAMDHHIPYKFGSFAVLIAPEKSANGTAMLLCCPQMGEPQANEPQINHEVELLCPAFHVAGMTIAGVPLIIIGRTERHAWSFTSGFTDNTDVYIETTSDDSFTSYLFDGEWLPFEAFTDTIQVVDGDPIIFEHYRTVHGPVFGHDLANQQAFSVKMTFWQRELDMMRMAYGLATAQSLAEVEDALALQSMSFNTFYADIDENIKFWHVGRYQDRTDGVDPRLPHNGDGSEEWQGFLDFSELPQDSDHPQGFYVNWNNKPVRWWNNGDNVPYHGNTSLTIRVQLIDSYVRPIEAFSYDNLKSVPQEINSHGTYQQALEVSTDGFVNAMNIVPPGQSGFIDLTGQPSPHFDDQWPLHLAWEYKTFNFDEGALHIETDSSMDGQTFEKTGNYPNPFAPETTIRFQLEQEQSVHLRIYDVTGRRVKTLLDNEVMPAGHHEVIWTGQTEAGSDAPAGMYLYRLRIGDRNAAQTVRRMIRLR